jgi:hypothetical protein
MAGDERDASRILEAIDSLLKRAKYDTVLGITERLIRKDPGHWEALYREGRALAALDRPAEATRRFQSILDLRRNDDEDGAIARARRRMAGGSRNSATTRPAGTPTAATTLTAQQI